MPSNESKIQENQKGDYVQFTTTIPKSLAEALDLGGATVKWEIVSGTKLSMEKLE